MTFEDILSAAGITAEQFIAYISKMRILGDIESKRAEIERKRAEQAASNQVFTCQLQALEQELNKLVEQANALL